MTAQRPFNDPFYFALPRGTTTAQARSAVQHIAATFGVTGKTEVVRKELGFTLCKITGGAA